ncbi:CD151 antigen [Geodia barretti]|uniref:Tetraspanin n=1 Tax=Geodia barretti TaxID=519541 RepID=A0AA35XKJ0_GEOBA|nr:CD151 antigen [Geodia barretti]
MARRFSNAVNCVRIAFFTLNCIFWVISLAVFALGAWLLYVREENDYDVITGSGSIVSGASLLVLGGGVAVVVAALGMVGAYGMWRPVLVTYILLVALIAISEISAGTISFLYREDINDSLEGRMVDAIEEYRATSDQEGYDRRKEANNAVDYIQERFECCGVNGSLDWLDLNPTVFLASGHQPPDECLCSNTTETNCQFFNFTYFPPNSFSSRQSQYYAWERGCLNLVEDELEIIAISVGVAGVAVGTIEVGAIVIAMYLCVCAVKTNKNSEVY